MSEFLAFYQQQAQKKVSSQPWLAQLQSQALNTLERDGFPTRHNEEWKYTSVDSLLKQLFSSSEYSSINRPYASDLPLENTRTIHNGCVLEEKHLLAMLPKGVLLMPLSVALVEHTELVKPYLGHILQQEHGFHALNTALIHSGIVLYIPRDVRIETPIVLDHFQDQSLNAVHLRHLIIADQGSEATVIEDYRGIEDCSYFTNTISEIFVGAHAHLTHYKIQRESKKAFHLGHTAVKQATSSHFASHSLNLGATLARSDINILLEAEQAHCLMNGIYAPTEGQHVDHHTTVHHLVPHCSSEQDYKGILKGRSKAVFNGKVLVAKDAQHTDAQQQNKNLLLSANAEINTKPQLEIFADDVVCSHGATVGQLDEDALFYLASRGIDKLEASQYLIHAFAEDNLRLIPHRELANWMSHLLTQQLG
jgi:Fe-S cluster assembly protein SufD